MSVEISDNSVQHIYSCLQSAMRSVGRNIQPPRCKDPTKTYQYRWTKTFADRCYNEWDLDDRAVKMLVYDIVRYASEHNLLSKGTQILCMGTIPDICHRSLLEAIEADTNLTVELTRCRTFLLEKGKDNLVNRLLEPVSIGGYTNLVYWYNLGYLTKTYIALSRTCLAALNALPEAERSELPSDADLLLTCTNTVTTDTVDELRSIIGNDLRIPPTARTKG